MLVRDDYGLVLTDLGLSKVVTDKQVLQTKRVGTPLWMAPEVRKSQYYGYSSDVFSMGLVFYELFERQLFDFDERENAADVPTKFPVRCDPSIFHLLICSLMLLSFRSLQRIHLIVRRRGKLLSL